MIDLGSSFIGAPNDYVSKHLYFVISKSNIGSDCVVCVNITTYHDNKDESCIIEPGEHGFIKEKSLVKFDKAILPKVENLEKALENGTIKPNVIAKKELINKIQVAFLTSKHTKTEERELVKKSLEENE